MSITSCNKRRIADAWGGSGTVFNDGTTYDTDWAADVCVPCAEGKYKDGTCKDCKPGTFTDEKDKPGCKDPECVAGKYGPAAQASSGAATCTHCAAGTFTSVTGTITCGEKTIKKCGPGKAYTEGKTSADDSSCANCAPGRWNNADDKTACADKTPRAWEATGTGQFHWAIHAACAAGKGYTVGTSIIVSHYSITVVHSTVVRLGLVISTLASQAFRNAFLFVCVSRNPKVSL